MRGLLLLALLLLPYAEFRVLWAVGEQIGPAPTLALLLLAAFAGAAIIRQAGLRTLTHARAELLAGRSPGGELLQGLVLFAAGLLLLIPGLLTDAAGLLLLLPLVRRTAADALGRKLTGRFSAFAFPGAVRPAGHRSTEQEPAPGAIRETAARVIEESPEHEP